MFFQSIGINNIIINKIILYVYALIRYMARQEQTMLNKEQ